jgi:enamine deaminase RidA (YjgF/YER057c/UK114 family)
VDEVKVRKKKADLAPTNSNMSMMEKIASNNQDLSDIKELTSTRVTDQLKVFLISQARNELTRVIKLTKFLDKLEDSFMNKVTEAMADDSLTLRQYSETISIITNLLNRSNTIISSVLKDDSLMTILNTTVYQSNGDKTAIVANLSDPHSREKVRNVLNKILFNTRNYEEGEVVDGSGSIVDDNNEQ